METTSKFTFNGWAIDGYLKVFWYDNPNHNVVQATGAVLPYLIVLMVLTGVFLGIARVMARRWEAV